jgi:hypothetical protein
VSVRSGDIRGGDGDKGAVAFMAADDVEKRELERARHPLRKTRLLMSISTSTSLFFEHFPKYCFSGSRGA